MTWAVRCNGARFRSLLLHLARVVLVIRHTSQFGSYGERCKHTVITFWFGIVGSLFPNYAFSFVVSITSHWLQPEDALLSQESFPCSRLSADVDSDKCCIVVDHPFLEGSAFFT